MVGCAKGKAHSLIFVRFDSRGRSGILVAANAVAGVLRRTSHFACSVIWRAHRRFQADSTIMLGSGGDSLGSTSPVDLDGVQRRIGIAASLPISCSTSNASSLPAASAWHYPGPFTAALSVRHTFEVMPRWLRLTSVASRALCRPYFGAQESY